MVWNRRSRALLLSCSTAIACAHGEGSQPRSASAERIAGADAGASVTLGTPEAQAELESCYQAALPSQPDLSVHTHALTIVRGDKVVFADLELPEEAELTRCLREAITSFRSPLPPGASTDGFGFGGFQIDLGPPLSTPPPRPSRQALEERRRRAIEEAFRTGALPRDDAQLQAALAPEQPSWPTAEHQAQMQACYAAAVRDRPGLAVHRMATFLARGATILAVDLRVPEAPELASCLKDRMLSWPSPFAQLTGETVISSLFIDLGAGPDWPAREGGLCEELARRDAMVAEAVQRGLIHESDPLIAKMKDGRPTRDPSGRSCGSIDADAGA